MSYTFYQYEKTILDNVQYSMIPSTEAWKYNAVSIDVFNCLDGKTMVYIAEHPTAGNMMILSEHEKIMGIYFGTWERLKSVFKAETKKELDDYITINPKFWDTEAEEIVSLSQLKDEYEELKKDGQTEAETFEDYLSNCLHKNGTLEPYENQDFAESEE